MTEIRWHDKTGHARRGARLHSKSKRERAQQDLLDNYILYRVYLRIDMIQLYIGELYVLCGLVARQMLIISLALDALF